MGTELVEYTIYLNKEGDINAETITITDQIASNAKLVGVREIDGTAFTGSIASGFVSSDSNMEVNLSGQMVTVTLKDDYLDTYAKTDDPTDDFAEVLKLQVIFDNWSNGSNWVYPYDSGENATKAVVENKITGNITLPSGEGAGNGSSKLVIHEADNSVLYLEPTAKKDRIGSDYSYSPTAEYGFKIGAGFHNQTGKDIPFILEDKLATTSEEKFYISNIVDPVFKDKNDISLTNYKIQYLLKNDGGVWKDLSGAFVSASVNAGLDDTNYANS